MQKNQKSLLALLIIALICMTMSSCTAQAAPSDVNLEQSAAAAGQDARQEILCSVKEINQFGSAVLDISTEEFLNRGFSCGDAVELQFGGKEKLSDLPIYNNFYGNMGDSLLSCFYDDLVITAISCSFARISGIKEGDSVRITMAAKGKYAELQKLYNLPNPKVRYDWQTDENFLNTRMLETGEIKPGRIYRGASPFDPEYVRCQIVSDYIDKNNIQTIINLSDNEDMIAGYGPMTQTASALLENGQVKFEKTGVDYASEETRLIVGEILEHIAHNKAPFLIHCSIGQDRTGFVCCALEAFCGANYDEIVADYMKSYENLYGFNQTSNPEKYRLIKKRIDFMLSVITGNDHPSEMPAKEIKKAAWDYCRKAGLSEEKLQQAFDNIAGFSLKNEANIPYPEGKDITVQGAASAPAEINHKNSPYFRCPDFYNMKSNKQLQILTHFPTYQQTSEYTCGPAAALMTMWYYNQRGMNEYEIADIMQTDTHVGTDVSKMVKFFQGQNWTVQSSLDTPPFAEPADFKSFVVNNLQDGHPIHVENVEWGGHWRVIIGYDDMGTETLLDDVLIFADSYDTADHLQDGYGVQNAVKFFYEWFDYQMLPASERIQPFVIAYPYRYHH